MWAGHHMLSTCCWPTNIMQHFPLAYPSPSEGSQVLFQQKLSSRFLPYYICIKTSLPAKLSRAIFPLTDFKRTQKPNIWNRMSAKFNFLKYMKRGVTKWKSLGRRHLETCVQRLSGLIMQIFGSLQSRTGSTQFLKCVLQFEFPRGIP